MSLKGNILVRIVKDWDHIDIFRQTYDGKGNWGCFSFTDEEISDCDVLIVFNSPHKRIEVNCRVGCSFLISHEPPIDRYKWMKNSYSKFDYVFNQFKPKRKNEIQTQGCLPWWVEKTYSDLVSFKLDDFSKKDRIATIISNRKDLPGHKVRLDFVNLLKNQGQIPFDLYGKGFEYVPSKFDCLKDYRYTLCIENTSKPHYWTEKIADAFLSYSMPIYYGAPNIFDYFPKGSLIQIDITKPEIAFQKIEEAFRMNLFQKNIEAIENARNLVLNEYQLFPYITNFIEKKMPNILERNKETYLFEENYWSKQSLKERVLKRITFRK